MIKEQEPYVISADVGSLMKQWGQVSQYSVPNSRYFDGMTNHLETVLQECFQTVDIVSYEQLRDGLGELIGRSRLPVISLDRAYVTPQNKKIVGFLDINRAVDENLLNLGVSSRPKTTSVDAQIRALAKRIMGNKITLVDDVVFEGGTIADVANWFAKKGIVVEHVIAGIAIQEGISKLTAQGINVSSVVTYEQVTDEICERDFVGGTPMSGRTVQARNGKSYGVPYFAPFGKAEQWASIPSNRVNDFSLFCLSQTIAMWEQVEKKSKNNISTQAVPKPIFKLQENPSIVRALKSL